MQWIDESSDSSSIEESVKEVPSAKKIVLSLFRFSRRYFYRNKGMLSKLLTIIVTYWNEGRLVLKRICEMEVNGAAKPHWVRVSRHHCGQT